MSRKAVELDFLGIEKHRHDDSAPSSSHLDRKRNFKGLQNAISKLDPQVLKSVLVPRFGDSDFNSRYLDDEPSAKQEPVFSHIDAVFPAKNLFSSSASPFPASVPSINGVSRQSNGTSSETSPLTIFYNGVVNVYNVPQDKAEMILLMAGSGNIIPMDANNSMLGKEGRQLFEKLNGDLLPIARKHSLQSFLEKRKNRLTANSPLAGSTAHGNKKLMESIKA